METDSPPALPPKAREQNILLKDGIEQRGHFYDDVYLPNDLSIIIQHSETEKSASNIPLCATPIPKPRLSKKQNRNVTEVVPSPRLSLSAQNSAHFFNPLYYAISSDNNDNSELIEVRGSCLSKRRSSDTDSIHFLEKHKPLLVKANVKEDWVPKCQNTSYFNRKQNIYNEDNRLTSLTDKKNFPFSAHIYEDCDKKLDGHSYEVVEAPLYERECRDIFDSVSFKSPLYETCLKSSISKNSEHTMHSLNVIPEIPDQTSFQPHGSDLYDIPIPELPPPAYPPPPLPLDVLLTTNDNGLLVCNLTKVSPPPTVPPRPPHNVNISAKKDMIPLPESQVEKDFTHSSHVNKSTVPTRPAPPVPRTTLQKHVPPPVPQRTSLTGCSSHLPTSMECASTSSQCEQLEDQNCAQNRIEDCTKQEINIHAEDSLSPLKDPHCGFLYKTGSNRKEFLQRWCVLHNSNLAYYLDKRATIPKSTIIKKDILGVAAISPDSIGNVSNNPDLCCFELATAKKEYGRQYLFGAKLPSERQEWINQLSLAIAPKKCQCLPSLNSIIQAGYLHVKEGTTGQWQMTWVVLYERTVLVYLIDLDKLHTIDLRKSMGIVKLPSTSSQGCAAAYEPGPVFHIDMPQQVLYLQGEWPHHTETWFQNVHHAWILPPGGSIEDQYLTQDNIPVVIDKCLNFISTHGTTDERIYRLAGSLTKVKKLLEAFSHNTWTVHLKPDEYSHHEAATALKRFLRSLNECLLTEKLLCLWIGASEIEDQDERLKRFKELLQRLPVINFQTLKKLIGHLLSISEHSDKNLMPVINLAVIFGPTIIFKHKDSDGFDCTNGAMDIVSDFITYYSWLFQVDPQEIEKERKIQQALELLREARIAQRPAGDILVGVYIYSKDWGKCLNVRLTPSMTAEQLCQHAISCASMKESVERLAVFEVVCNEELERPLHYTEIVLAVTLRWASWADSDAKCNYLCIKHNYVHDAIMPFVQSRQPLSMFSELKFADTRSKTFKKLLFEFIGAKLTCYKDARASRPVGQWNVEDITWYIGSELKRSPPTKWVFTFIDRNAPVKRTKENPYFGRTVCCSLEEEYHRWLAAMLVGEHSQNLFPSRHLPDLLS